MPTIPGHANSDWSNILPSILSSDMETISSNDPASIYVSEMPEVIKTDPIISQKNNNGLSSSNQVIQEEKPMIQVPVITVEEKLSNHQHQLLSAQYENEQVHNDGPVFEKLNTISADKLKGQKPTYTHAETTTNNKFGHNQITGAPEFIDQSTKKPQVSQSVKEPLKNKTQLENNNGTIVAVVAETHSTSIKIPGHDEIKIHETKKPKPDTIKPTLFVSINKEKPGDSVKLNQTKIFNEKTKLEIKMPNETKKNTSEGTRPDDNKKPLVKPVLLHNIPSKPLPTKFDVEKTTFAPIKKTPEQTTVKISTEMPTKTTDILGIPVILLSNEQTINKKITTTTETLSLSTTTKPEVKTTATYTTPVTTVKVDVPSTTLTSITTTSKLSSTMTTTTAPLTEPVLQEMSDLKLTKPAVETKIKDGEEVPSTTEALKIISTTEVPTTIEIVTNAKTEKTTEITVKLNELVSTTEVVPASLGTLSSTKKPMDPLPTDLADSLSSMISQISEDVPSVLSPIDEKKPEVLLSDVKDKEEVIITEITTLKSLMDILMEATTVGEKISTEVASDESSSLAGDFYSTENPTTVKYELNDQPEGLLVVENKTEIAEKNYNATIVTEEVTTVQPTSTEAIVTTTEVIRVNTGEQSLNNLNNLKIGNQSSESNSLLNETKGTVTEKSVVNKDSETPIVRIDIMETKPDTTAKLNGTESIDKSTQSPLVRIQLKETISSINQLLESSPIVTSTPAVEILKMPPDGTAGANNIGSGLIAGYPSDDTTTQDYKSSVDEKLESKEDFGISIDATTTFKTPTINVEEKLTITEKTESTTEQIQAEESVTELNIQKIEFDKLPMLSGKKKFSASSTTPRVEIAEKKTEAMRVEITTESLLNSTEIPMVKDVQTTLVIDNVHSTEEIIISSSTQSLGVSTEIPKTMIETVDTKNTTMAIEATTLASLEKLNETKLTANGSKPLKSDVPVVRVDTSPEIQINHFQNLMKPTAPKKSDDNDTFIIPTEQTRIQVNQTAVKVTKRPTIPSETQETSTLKTEYDNDPYKKLGETSAYTLSQAKPSDLPPVTSPVPEKSTKNPLSEAALKVKDQKKDSSMELLETMMPNQISQGLKPMLPVKIDQLPSQSVKPEKIMPFKPTEKPVIPPKKDESDQIPVESEKWTLIPQKTPPAATKPGNHGNKKPVEAIVEKESKTPTANNEAPEISLDHATSAKGLDSSVKDLDNDISYFTNLCNDLAFTFWTATNQGLNTARSLALSPFGMTSMLAMVFLGARGPTSDKMNDVLRLDDVASFNPHLVFQNVTDSVSLARKQGIANAAFVRELFADRLRVRKLMPFYKEQAQQFYDGTVAEVNFATIGDLARRRTNLMIRKQTGGRIKDFVRGNNVPLRAPLAALSANVFQTDCNYGDASSEGRDGEFYFAVSAAIRQRKLILVPGTVWRSGVLAGYEPGLDATAVSLGGPDKLISTIFVIPGQQGFTAPGDNLESLEERLIRGAAHDGAWNKLLKVIIPRPGLELQLPKFSHKSFINATSALKRMGLEELFGRHANLKGINGGGTDLHLSDVLQVVFYFKIAHCLFFFTVNMDTKKILFLFAFLDKSLQHLW